MFKYETLPFYCCSNWPDSSGLFDYWYIGDIQAITLLKLENGELHSTESLSTRNLGEVLGDKQKIDKYKLITGSYSFFPNKFYNLEYLNGSLGEEFFHN